MSLCKRELLLRVFRKNFAKKLTSEKRMRAGGIGSNAMLMFSFFCVMIHCLVAYLQYYCRGVVKPKNCINVSTFWLIEFQTVPSQPKTMMIFIKLVFNPADGQRQHFGETLKISSLLQRDTPSSIQGIQNCYENYGYATYPDSRVRLALFLHSRSTPGPFGWINFLFYGCSESPGCY